VFLINSRLNQFSAPLSRGVHLSRSYVVILPSSLAMNHSSTLGYSPQLPVSVSGTGTIYLKLRGFSWKSDYNLIQLPEGSRYCQVRHSLAINQKIYLHPLAYYSVSTQVFHYFVTPSQYMLVQEY
jgi:hypothetical protein